MSNPFDNNHQTIVEKKYQFPNEYHLDFFKAKYDLKDKLEFHDRVKKLIEIEKSNFVEQGTEKWRERRKNMLTASDAGAILGNNPYEKNDSVYKRKTNQLKEKQFSRAMTHGIENEGNAIFEYEKITNRKIMKFGLISHKDYDYLGASPDGIDPFDGVLIEVKCPSKPISLDIEPYYMDQVQMQLYVLELDICHFIKFKPYPFQLAIIPIKKDPKWEENALPILKSTFEKIQYYKKMNPNWDKFKHETFDLETLK